VDFDWGSKFGVWQFGVGQLEEAADVTSNFELPNCHTPYLDPPSAFPESANFGSEIVSYVTTPSLAHSTAASA